MLGGISAAAVAKALFSGPLTVATTLNGGTSKAQGVFIEMVHSPQDHIYPGLLLTLFAVLNSTTCLHNIHVGG